MHLRRTKALALTTCIVFAVTAIADFPSMAGYDFGTVSSAQAGNGNGNGGGGNGGGGGNSGGGGNGGGNSSSKSNGNGSASAGSRGNGNGGNGGGLGKSGGFFGLFASRSNSSAPKKTVNSPASNLAKANGGRTSKTKSASTVKVAKKSPAAMVQLAAVPTPGIKPVKEKNFHAKLAGLNSLNRNYMAYINSSDPRLEAIRSYMMASIDTEKAQESLAQALASLGPAQDAFISAVTTAYGGVTTYDGFAPVDPDIESLESRLNELQNLDLTLLTTEQAGYVQNEIDAINAALSSEEAGTLSALQDQADNAQERIDLLADQVTDEALAEALLAAANENRVNEYGAENYVDDEMLNWAKDLLGVDDAVGKIDQMREALEAEQETAGAIVPATDETDS